MSPASSSPVRLLRSTLSALALVLVLLPAPLLLIGCGGSSAPVDVEEPETPKERDRRLKKEKEENSKKELAKLRRGIESNETAYDEHLQALESFTFAFHDMPEAKTARELMDEVKAAREAKAEQILEEHFDEANTLALEKKYDEAIEKLREFPDEAPFAGVTPSWDRYERRVRTLEDQADGEFKARTLMDNAERFYAEGKLAEAIGMLLAFPDRYEGTAYYADVQERADAYLIDYTKERKALLAKESVPFEDVPITDSFDKLFEHPGGRAIWNNEDGTLVAELDESAGVPKSCMLIGGENLEEWEAEFEIRFDGDGALRLGTGWRPTGMIKGFFAWPEEDFETDKWYRLRVSLKGAQYRIFDLDSNQVLNEHRVRGFPCGPTIWVHPGQEVKVRGIRLKVISTFEEPSDEGDDSGDDSGDDETR